MDRSGVVAEVIVICLSKRNLKMERVVEEGAWDKWCLGILRTDDE